MKRFIILSLMMIFLMGCASFREFETRFDDGIMAELRRYPCEDPGGYCAEKLEGWIVRP